MPTYLARQAHDSKLWKSPAPFPKVVASRLQLDTVPSDRMQKSWAVLPWFALAISSVSRADACACACSTVHERADDRDLLGKARRPCSSSLAQSARSIARNRMAIQ